MPRVARMNKTVSIRSNANPLWKQAARMARYYEDQSLGDFLTDHLQRFVDRKTTEEADKKLNSIK